MTTYKGLKCYYWFIPKPQRCNGLVLDALFFLTFYNGCSYLSRLGLKINHASKRGPCVTVSPNHPDGKVHGTNTGPPGSCRPQMGPILAPWSLLSGHLPTITITSTNSRSLRLLEPLFTKRQDVLPLKLVKFRSCDNRCYIALKLDGYLRSAAVEKNIKF